MRNKEIEEYLNKIDKQVDITNELLEKNDKTANDMMANFNQQLSHINDTLIWQRDAALRTMVYDAGERRFKIQKVRSDIDANARNAVAKTVICGAGVLAFTTFASIAVQKMGLDNSIIAELQQNHELMANQPMSGDGMINTIVEYLQNYVTTVFGPLNKYLTLENAQDFVNELGPVGSIAGLISLISGKSAAKNFNEWAKKNRELEVMRETMPQDVVAGKKAFAEFSFKVMLESMHNSFGKGFEEIIKHCATSFKELKESFKTKNSKNKLNMMASKMQELNQTGISKENTNGRSR